MAIATENALTQHCKQTLGKKAEESEKTETEKDGQKTLCKEDQAKLWHLRLGHALPVRTVKSQLKLGNLPPPKCSQEDCGECTIGKYRKRFSGTLTGMTKVGKLHVDTKGQVEESSVDGHRYFLTVVEEYSRYIYVCPMVTKGQASDQLLHFIKCFEKQSGHVIREVHADGGGESKRSKKWLEGQGVKCTLSTPYTPQSNGLAERAHGVVLSLARTCLHQA